MHDELKAMAAMLTPAQRLMGLDVGAKTVGLALSDSGLLVATPLETLRRTRIGADARRLAAVAAEHGVGGLVVGLPIEMNGSEGRRCQSVRQFVRNIGAQVSLPVAFWDERLSTAAVERLLVDEVDMTRRRRRQVVDKMAAAYILQGALDALAGARKDGTARPDGRP